jgi:hypothetical protein
MPRCLNTNNPQDALQSDWQETNEVHPAYIQNVPDHFTAGSLRVLATPPTEPVAADVYFDSTLEKARVYDGTEWGDFPAEGGGVAGVTSVEAPGELPIDGHVKFTGSGAVSVSQVGLDTINIHAPAPFDPMTVVSSLNSEVGGVNLVGAGGTTVQAHPTLAKTIQISSNSASGVTALRINEETTDLAGIVSLKSDGGTTLTRVGNDITISSEGTGGAGVSSLNTEQGALTLTGSGAVSVANVGSAFTISGTDTQYTAGNGLVLAANEFENDGLLSLNSKKGVVHLTAGANVSIDDSTPGVIEISAVSGGSEYTAGTGIYINATHQVSNTGVLSVNAQGTSSKVGDILFKAGTGMEIVDGTGPDAGALVFNSTVTGGTAGVTSVNGEDGAITLLPGDNVTIAQAGKAFTVNATLTQGPPGQDGADGVDGAPGAPGADGADGKVYTSGAGIVVDNVADVISNSGVRSVNAKTGDLSIVAGSNVSIDDTQAGQVVISATNSEPITYTGGLGIVVDNATDTIINSGVRSINSTKTGSVSIVGGQNVSVDNTLAGQVIINSSAMGGGTTTQLYLNNPRNDDPDLPVVSFDNANADGVMLDRVIFTKGHNISMDVEPHTDANGNQYHRLYINASYYGAESGDGAAKSLIGGVFGGLFASGMSGPDFDLEVSMGDGNFESLFNAVSRKYDTLQEFLDDDPRDGELALIWDETVQTPSIHTARLVQKYDNYVIEYPRLDDIPSLVSELSNDAAYITNADDIRFVQTVQPVSPAVNEVYLDTANEILKRWDGLQWKDLGNNLELPTWVTDPQSTVDAAQFNLANLPHLVARGIRALLTEPLNPQKGDMYFDDVSGQIKLFDTLWRPLGDYIGGVSTVNGMDGAITISGSAVSNNIPGKTVLIQNTTYSAGTGLGLTDTTFSNSGVLSLEGLTGNIDVLGININVDIDGQTLRLTGAGGGVSQINAAGSSFTGAVNITPGANVELADLGANTLQIAAPYASEIVPHASAPVGEAGKVYFDTSLSRFYEHDGSAWKPLGESALPGWVQNDQSSIALSGFNDNLPRVKTLNGLSNDVTLVGVGDVGVATNGQDVQISFAQSPAQSVQRLAIQPDSNHNSEGGELYYDTIQKSLYVRTGDGPFSRFYEVRTNNNNMEFQPITDVRVFDQAFAYSETTLNTSVTPPLRIYFDPVNADIDFDGFALILWNKRKAYNREFGYPVTPRDADEEVDYKILRRFFKYDLVEGSSPYFNVRPMVYSPSGRLLIDFREHMALKTYEDDFYTDWVLFVSTFKNSVSKVPNWDDWATKGEYPGRSFVITVGNILNLQPVEFSPSNYSEGFGNRPHVSTTGPVVDLWDAATGAQSGSDDEFNLFPGVTLGDMANIFSPISHFGIFAVEDTPSHARHPVEVVGDTQNANVSVVAPTQGVVVQEVLNGISVRNADTMLHPPSSSSVAAISSFCSAYDSYFGDYTYRHSVDKRASYSKILNSDFVRDVPGVPDGFVYIFSQHQVPVRKTRKNKVVWKGRNRSDRLAGYYAFSNGAWQDVPASNGLIVPILSYKRNLNGVMDDSVYFREYGLGEQTAVGFDPDEIWANYSSVPPAEPTDWLYYMFQRSYSILKFGTPDLVESIFPDLSYISFRSWYEDHIASKTDRSDFFAFGSEVGPDGFTVKKFVFWHPQWFIGSGPWAGVAQADMNRLRNNLSA